MDTHAHTTHPTDAAMGMPETVTDSMDGHGTAPPENRTLAGVIGTGSPPELFDRLTGVLLATALGDALGLPAEGMSAARIARQFGRIDRFRLLGRTGFVSDDTELSALVAESLALHVDRPDAFADAFRHRLRAWFWRLPWGVGLATVKACLRITLGLRASGVPSAGNGAAMRAGILGAYFANDAQKREEFGRALARVTHTDERAIAGALFVADLTAALVRGESVPASVREAHSRVREPRLGEGLDRALALHATGTSLEGAAQELGTSGYVLHTVPFALFAFLQRSDQPRECLSDAIVAGGDTDTIGAIVGGWLGALHGVAGLPCDLIQEIQDGPFGPTHLRALAAALHARQRGEAVTVPRYSAPLAMARNLALYPVILAHGLRRLIP